MITIKMKEILLIVILLLGFGCRGIQEGTVIDKWYEPSSKQFLGLTQRAVPSGGSFTTISVPTWRYDDEDWVIKIEGFSKKHEPLTNVFYVSEKMFKSISIGDYFVNNNCDTSDN